MKHMYILWYDNGVDSPIFISAHWTQEGAYQAALRWAETQTYGRWGSTLVAELVEVFD